jgi:flavin-dependent dehydrogenase
MMIGLARERSLAPWRRDPDAALLAYLRSGTLTGPLLEGSRQVTKVIGVVGLRFFMKQPVGRGWALVGDAGLHMDPTPGLGITDAVRDAIALAEAIVDGRERAFEIYWRRRDADSIGLYRMAADMGSEGYNNPFTRMVYRKVQTSPAMRARMLAVLDRERRPQDLMTLPRLAGWLAAEALTGRFRSISGFGRTLANAARVVREQADLDRKLAAALATTSPR